MKRFYNIELLRFFSALSVLIYHYQHFFGPYSSFSITDINNNKFTQPFYSSLEILYNYRYYGVPMFWSISGFVFAYVYLEQQKDISGKNFFVNRFARLYPLHFATLLIVTLLQIISYKLTGNFQIYTFNELYHFLLHLFFISGWGFQIGNSFNEPIWSVSVELIIYILFFISIIYLNKYKIKLVVLIYLIFLSIDKSGFESIFIDCARLFYTGVFVYFLYEKFEKNFI